ncbi:MAG: hypothetical protein AABX70_01170 [Nanoarchaeota archaeon]
MGVEVTVTPSKAKKWIWIILILIILGGGGFAAWKFGLVAKASGLLHKTPTPTASDQSIPQITPPQQTPSTNTNTPSTSETETKTPSEEPPQEALPEVTGDGTLTLDVGNVEFESKTLKGKDNKTTTKYKVSSITLTITNNQANPVNLNGTLMVLDSKGNNVVSSNFIYKHLEIGEIKMGEPYNRKQPVNTAGDIRPYLTSVAKGDQVSVQITLVDMATGKVVKTSKKTAVVG